MTGQATFEGHAASALSDENKAFLDGIQERTAQLVQEFGEQLLDIEKRTGRTVGIDRDFEVEGRTVRFTVELLPENHGSLVALLEALASSFCDCPDGECKNGQQGELPLDKPKNVYVN